MRFASTEASLLVIAPLVVPFLFTSKGSSNALNLESDSNLTIPAIASTWAAPGVFSDAGWGFAVPTGSAATDTLVTPFTANYRIYDSTLATDILPNNAIYNSTTWAAVPKLSAAQQIWSAETSNSYGFGGMNGDTTNDRFDIYYAVMVDTDILAGSYKNSLVYTAIARSDTLDTVSKNISRSRQYVAADDIETLAFDLSSSTNGLIQSSDVTVWLVPHAIAEANGYLATSDLISMRDVGRFSTCVITAFSATTTGTSLDCTLPKLAPLGDNDGEGEYDLWVSIAKYNIDYFTKYVDPVNSAETIPSIAYYGLQSKNAAGFVVDEMQDMTASICKNTNIWGVGTGTSAKVYPYDTVDLSLSTEATPLTGGTASHSYDSLFGVGSFLLTDNRDNKDYLVRRLADGNCWMVQNLDLDLAAFAGTNNLTSENTDLNGKDAWNPDADELIFVSNDTAAVHIENGYTYVGGVSVQTDSEWMIEHATQYTGDYYSWYAATAQSGSPTIGGDAEDSVCPRGWRLPVTVSSFVTNPEKSLQMLTRSATNGYGLITAEPGDDNSYNIAVATTLSETPLSMWKTGYGNVSSRTIGSYNKVIVYASSSAKDDTQIYRFYVYADPVNDRSAIWTFGTALKSERVPIRCVAR